MKNISFRSPDRVGRRDFGRALIRRAAGERVDVSTLGRRIGYTDSRWKTMMTNGELASPSVFDGAVLSDALDSDILIEELARARGKRLVCEPSAIVTSGDILAGISEALAGVAAVATAGTAALADGVLDPVEARTIQQKIDAARRALAELEGRVASAVVEPLRRSGR